MLDRGHGVCRNAGIRGALSVIFTFRVRLVQSMCVDDLAQFALSEQNQQLAITRVRVACFLHPYFV